MVAEADYNALLGDLYAGATDPGRFGHFLDRLSRASRSHLTVFIRDEFHGSARPVFLARDFDPSLRARYEAEPAEDDKLWFLRSAREMKTGVVLNGEDWATAAEIRRTRYYDAVLRNIDTLHSAAICGELSTRRAAFLTPCRSSRTGPYGVDEMSLFRQVAPHWVNAFALTISFERLQAQAAVPDRHRRALFLLDSEMRWVGGNGAAECVVAARWLCGHKGGRLDSGSAVTRVAWQRAQRALSTVGPSSRPQVVPLNDALERLVAFASIQAYGAAAPGEGIPSFAMFVRPLSTDDDGDIAMQLRSMFDLTPGEAALAAALRNHGSLHDAAGALGLSDGSARTRLQAVYEKTSMHRQSHLLRMLDALADAIA